MPFARENRVKGRFSPTPFTNKRRLAMRRRLGAGIASTRDGGSPRGTLSIVFCVLVNVWLGLFALGGLSLVVTPLPSVHELPAHQLATLAGWRLIWFRWRMWRHYSSPQAAPMWSWSCQWPRSALPLRSSSCPDRWALRRRFCLFAASHADVFGAISPLIFVAILLGMAVTSPEASGYSKD